MSEAQGGNTTGKFEEIVYAALVVFALILLPVALIESADGAKQNDAKVFSIIGRHHHNIHGVLGDTPEDAYWTVSEGAKWRFIDSDIVSEGYGKNEIRVKQGDTVTLRITSYDSVHGFALPAYKINERIYPGKVTEVTFKADKKGEHVFFCSIICGMPGHQWMKGKLIIE